MNVRSRFSADELQIVQGEAEDTFVVHFGRKNQYRYLTYTTIIGNSFDIKAESDNVLIKHVNY